MKNQRVKRAGSILLAVLIFAGALPEQPVYAKPKDEAVYEGTEHEAAEPETETEAEEILWETFRIKTWEDLLRFSENCHMDAWSENKIVELEEDIVLPKGEFEPIPVFSGIFHGNGHTISDFSCQGFGYADGFFRYITENGIVEDLTLTGVVEAQNAKESTGGICGVNRGQILNCHYAGIVEGKKHIGGIAGENRSTGVISDCSIQGSVTGYDGIGGITGWNSGTLYGCVNKAGINSDSSWLEEEDEAGLSWILEEASEHKLVSGTDIGGIAGYSVGLIISCRNRGEVGYEHNGYNIGGIAGRQSGRVVSCSNYGQVYGRKDVGGIVGQMEPYISIDEAQSLSYEVQKLHDLIGKLLDDIEESQGTVGDEFDLLRQHSDGALDEADSLSGQLTGFVDDNIKTVNDLSSRIDYALKHLPAVFDDADAAIDTMKIVTEDLDKTVEALRFMDRVEDTPYQETARQRLSLVSGVGGEISADNRNPQQGETVTITVTPQEGYQLKEIAAVDAAGNSLPLSKTGGNQYLFQMPVSNVVVKAAFASTGSFDAGGTVLVSVESESTASLSLTQTAAQAPGKTPIPTVTALPEPTAATPESTSEPEEGLGPESTSEPGKEPGAESTSEPEEGLGSESTSESEKESGSESTSEPAETPAPEATAGGAARMMPVEVPKTDSESKSGEVSRLNSDIFRSGFTLYAGTERNITVRVTDGKNLPESKDTAPAGDRVRLLLTPDSGCRGLKPVVKGASGDNIEVNAVGTSNLYEFTMPDEDVTAEVQFAPACILESTPGGKAGCQVSGSRISLTVTPNAGYRLKGTPVAENKNGNNLTVSGKSTGANTYEISYAFDDLDTGDIVRVYISFEQGTNSQAVDASWNQLQTDVERLQGSMADISAKIDELQKKGSNADVEDIVDLAEELADAGELLADILHNLSVMGNVLTPYVEQALSEAGVQLEKVMDGLEKTFQSLEDAFQKVRGIIVYLNGQTDLKFATLGGDFDGSVNALFDQMRSISDVAAQIGSSMDHYTEVVTEDMRGVNDQINVIFQLLLERIEDAEDYYLEKNLYEDISDEEIEESVNGKVETSLNNGVVRGDVNVGGITGSMAIDEEDPEGNAAGSMEHTLGSRYFTRCIVSGCKNEGKITAKKDGAGGIAGYMNLGIITDSEGYGQVESKEGEYIGGICGQSLALIRGCWALTTLKGERYVGGIAGYGTRLQNCYAMIHMDDDPVRKGVIAGWVKQEDEEQDGYGEAVWGNRFVNESLNGIDNVSYQDAAQPITYQELLAVENVPLAYRHLKITFLAEDRILAQQEVKYGELLSHVAFPPIPAEEGTYGKWRDVTGEKMESNLTLEAEYYDSITTIQSPISKEEDSVGEIGKPYALLDGSYTDEAVLHVERQTYSAKEIREIIPGASSEAVIYQINVQGTQLTPQDVSKLRLLNPIMRETENGWEEVPYKEYGAYLQVELAGTAGRYCILSHSSRRLRWIIGGAGVLAAVLLVFLIWKTAAKGHTSRRRNK